MTYPTFAFVAAATDEAQAARAKLQAQYQAASPEEAEIIVALGGDGFMLETLHATLDRDVAIFGMNCGTVGFLMNGFDEEGLADRLAAAERVTLHPLRMTAATTGGEQVTALAINEISLYRQAHQAAHVSIAIDGVTRLPELICDGVLVATPAGSTAYNFSAHGPIIPLGAQLLALTPISAFRPRRWRGALLPNTATVSFEVLYPEKRPVGATADSAEVRDVLRVEVSEAPDIALSLLFDPEHNLEQRVIQEQFAS